MARLFGLISNRADLTVRILAHEADALRVRSGSSLGWGVGFVQGGEVLMRRRPVDDRPDLDVGSMFTDVRTDFLLGHVRRATVGALRPENTHPFRYRQWLFAQTGTVEKFDQVREKLLESVPEFLRSGIRGETDAEVVFHIFLSFLHDAGQVEATSIKTTNEALRSTLALLDAAAAEAGADPSSLNILLGNGEMLVAANRGARMAYRLFHGKHDAEALIGDDINLRRKIPELTQMHAVLLASDFGPVSAVVSPSSPPSSVDPKRAPGAPWVTVPERSLVVLERGAAPVLDSL